MKTILLLVVLCICASCSQRGQEEKSLLELERNLYTVPSPDNLDLDSVYNVLKKMESQKHVLGKDYCDLLDRLLIKVKNKLLVPLTDNDAQVLHEQLSKEDDVNVKFDILYLLGCTYRDLKDYPEAARYLLEAYNYGEKYSIHPYLMERNLGQLADIYLYMALYDSFHEVNNKVIHYAKQIKDSLFIGVSLDYEAGVYNMRDEFEKAIICSDEAYKVLDESGEREMALRTRFIKLQSLRNLDKWKEYRTLLDEIENSEIIVGGVPIKGVETYYISKGWLLIHDGCYYEAIEYLRKGKSIPTEKFYLDTNFDELLSIAYKNIGETDKALALLDSSYENYVKYFRKDAANAVAQLKCSYDYSRQQQKALEAERESRHKTIIIAVGCIIMLLILGSSAFTVLFLRHKAAKRDADFEILRLNLEKEIQALKEAQKSNITESADSKEANNIQEARIAIRESLAEMLVEKRHLTDEKEQELITLANTHFPGFVTVLVGLVPKLSATETTVAILTRFGLRPSEIATLLAKQPSAITNTIVRLHTKATGISTNSTESKDWLVNLSVPPHKAAEVAK